MPKMYGLFDAQTGSAPAMNNQSKGDTMRYYLFQGFNLVAHVPTDARPETIDICENLRNRLVDRAIMPGRLLVDRAIGVIDGGKSDGH